MFNPPHPGQILAEQLDFLEIDAKEFADRIGVAYDSLVKVVNEAAPITEEMAAAIAKELSGPSADMWLRMQADHDAWNRGHR